MFARIKSLGSSIKLLTTSFFLGGASAAVSNNTFYTACFNFNNTLEQSRYYLLNCTSEAALNNVTDYLASGCSIFKTFLENCSTNLTDLISLGNDTVSCILNYRLSNDTADFFDEEKGRCIFDALNYVIPSVPYDFYDYLLPAVAISIVIAICVCEVKAHSVPASHFGLFAANDAERKFKELVIEGDEENACEESQFLKKGNAV